MRTIARFQAFGFPRILRLPCFAFVAAALFLTSCGIVPSPLPDAVDDLTLQRIQEIRSDPTLTNDERAQILRDLLGLEDDDAGNRAVNFLLNLNLT